MKYGICVDIEELKRVEAAKNCGFDYMEANFTYLTRCEDEVYNAFTACIREIGFPCDAANCFVPGDLKLTGGEIDYPAIADYLAKGMERAKNAGLATVVFGSAGARNVPEGFPKDKAFDQLAYFLANYAGPAAEKAGLQIAIEPLQKGESNIINFVADGVELAEKCGHRAVFGLGDLYHMFLLEDKIEDLYDLKGKILHSHIAFPIGRRYPRPDDGFDYRPFVKAMSDIGCPRCSVEAGFNDFFEDAPLALKAIKF
ncbi:MAG: sugar phosphate isomerase/epimerase [Oscillospiraceae bacterium]|nr:sugar phosphate isomerase/epimerase [Oscillospiraceae bacterium]